MNKEEYIKREEGAMLHTYNRFPVVLEKGEGVYLYDTDGKKYLDFAAGIAVEALGYGNRKYNDALKDQIDKLMHTSNLYYNLPIMEAAEKILKYPRWTESFLPTAEQRRSRVRSRRQKSMLIPETAIRIMRSLL